MASVPRSGKGRTEVLAGAAGFRAKNECPEKQHKTANFEPLSHSLYPLLATVASYIADKRSALALGARLTIQGIQNGFDQITLIHRRKRVTGTLLS